MKGILITAAIIGAAAAAIIIYLSDQPTTFGGGSDLEDAAEDAYDTMNKHIGRVERGTEDALDTALGI